MRLLLALLLAPTATALDALPEAAHLGARDATVVVRAAGEIRVTADAPLAAGLADGLLVPTPARLAVPPDAAWHGLPGAVEVRLRREDPSRDVRVELDDGATGVVVEWPARRDAPSPPALLAVLVVAAAARVPRGVQSARTRGVRRSSPSCASSRWTS